MLRRKKKGNVVPRPTAVEALGCEIGAPANIYPFNALGVRHLVLPIFPGSRPWIRTLLIGFTSVQHFLGIWVHRSSFFTSSSNLVLIHLVVRATMRLCVLRHPNRLSFPRHYTTFSPAARVPPTHEGMNLQFGRDTSVENILAKTNRHRLLTNQ